MDTRVFDGLTDEEFFVIYWVCNGMDYPHIADRFDYSLSWVQKKASAAHKKFGLGDLLPRDRAKIMEETICPALHEWIENHPEKIKRLPEPPPISSIQTVQTTFPVPTGRESPIRYWRAILVLLLIILAVAFGSYLLGQRNQTPIVTATFTATPPPSPTITLSPTQAQTETPLPPTATPTVAITATHGVYTAGEWFTIREGVFITLKDQFLVNANCTPPVPGFQLTFLVHIPGNQFAMRWDASAFHAQDDLGNNYTLIGSGTNLCNEVGPQERDWNGDYYINMMFSGTPPLDAKYLEITADSLSGVKVVFRKYY